MRIENMLKACVLTHEHPTHAWSVTEFRVVGWGRVGEHVSRVLVESLYVFGGRSPVQKTCWAKARSAEAALMQRVGNQHHQTKWTFRVGPIERNSAT